MCDLHWASFSLRTFTYKCILVDVSGPDKHRAGPSPSTGLQNGGDKEHIHLEYMCPDVVFDGLKTRGEIPCVR